MTILPDRKTRLRRVDRIGGDDSRPGDSLHPFVGEDISAETYRLIGDILQAEQGFDLTGYKQLCIKRRVAARIRAVGSDQAEQYIELLQGSGEEQEQLLEALTVNVSQFYRNPSTFAVLEQKILPELLRNRSKNSKLRIWSAGCASGEEPYTLALLCQQLQPDDEQLSILATDISNEILQHAKLGCYGENRLTEVPPATLERYFTRQEKLYQLDESIRRRVRFFRHDILTEKPCFRVDLVLCRNLLIYFSRAQQEQILRGLASVLPVDGYLVLGRAETLVASARELFQCIDPAERIYQRLANK